MIGLAGTTMQRSRLSARELNLESSSLPAVRLHSSQLHKIAKAKALRLNAQDLRILVSAGTYGEIERERFYKLVKASGAVLDISYPELARRAGLGENFFPTLVRDRRYPKLANFLRALTAIIDVADERLYDIDRTIQATAPPSIEKGIEERIRQDRSELQILAHSLSLMAQHEIEKLDSARPNDPNRIIEYERQRELLLIFANGFAQIARSLSLIDANAIDPLLLRKSIKVIERVGNGFNEWWAKNQDEAIDWTIRIPVIVAGVAALGWAGADMTVGTTTVAALVGGKKVLKAITKGVSKLRRKK